VARWRTRGSIAAQGKLTIRSADLGNDGLLQAGDVLNIDAGSSTIRNTNSGSDRGSWRKDR
jgi:adhesin HecA-like repeat protein